MSEPLASCERVDALLPDAAAYAAAYAALPAWRRRKCDALRFAADRRRSVAAWLLLKRLLEARGICAEKLEVAENEFGRPECGSAAGVQFSLSHSGERVMAAVSARPVGCDVERLAAYDDALARECLAPLEQSWLFGLPDAAARARGFIRLWTRKEGYVKAVGRGLAADLRALDVRAEAFPAGWRFRDLDFEDGYLGCVVSPV